MCGKHALNNVLGGEGHIIFTNEHLKDACDGVVFESLIPDREGGVPADPTSHEDHMGDNGWYSEQVLAETLRRTFLYELCLQPLHCNPNVIYEDEVVGAVVNQDNVHWVALKRVEDHLWLLNSTEPQPETLSWSQYMSLINEFRNAFPIRRL